MFNIGDYVVYGTEGVCEVKDIGTLDMDGVPQDRRYYFLMPIGSSRSMIYSPVDSVKARIRRIMTKDEVERLIDSIPNISMLEAPSDKLLEEKYRESVRSCDPTEIMRIIKTTFFRKEARIREHKKVTALDDRYQKQAQTYLHAEIAVVLSIPAEQVPDYIIGRIEGKDTH